MLKVFSRSILSGAGFFRYWVGYGAGAYGLLSLWVAGLAGVQWLALTIVVWAVWWWETATGFCRRCTHFNCGPHGYLMRSFFARDLSPLPRWRLRLHLGADLCVFLWSQIWIWSWPWLGAATLVWFAIAAVAVLPVHEAARRDVAKLGRVLPPSAG